ncbi:MAG: bifunctional adenosylcobinamide kinase/adenosylcobinamide-phosphate guanylyltransferase [Desulfobacteraceae bacterium]|nr:bifunctional adenosylcobinamide kinase/adenosylcobinamide-phosphate guanylyltransferase [Desulfobacteraceae bacterium]
MDKKKEVHLVLGGCRSGKSRYALGLADEVSGRVNIFAATCVPADEEMKARVLRHQQERDRKWTTVEAPLALPGAIRKHSTDADVIIVDCLTLWISNLMGRHENDESVMEQVGNLANELDKTNCPVFLVSNEVGSGVVPENFMARRFRDFAGFANQHIASRADRVTWMVAGIPVNIR